MKRLFLVLIAMIAFAGCAGPKGDPGAQGLQGIAGATGPSGSNGSDGANGHNSLVAILSSAPDCENGGITVLSGLDANDSGVLDLTEVSGSAEVCNGVNGTNGIDGTNGTDATVSDYTPVSIVDPCGDKAGIYDEVFLRLKNGMLVASFSDDANGKNTHFAVLTAGSYETTDGSRCYFSVDDSGNLYDEHY